MNMRYLVRDEERVPLRKFWTHEEALQFLQPGYTVDTLPAPPKLPRVDLVAVYGEALF